MHLFDHTTTTWRQQDKLINGAVTYSTDIVKFQVPEWEQTLGPHDLLSTAPPPCTINLPAKINTAVIYLHSWPMVSDFWTFQSRFAIPAKNVVYITAYRKYCQILKAYGYKAVYIPMTIDTEDIKQYIVPKSHEGFIYYGNVMQVKQTTYRKIKAACKALNIHLDTLSHNLYNGVPVSHEQALSIVSSYNYGIGVGRCALEMMALNVKTFIAGRRVGGLITNKKEYELQRAVNMNGRIYTHSGDIPTCLLNIDKAICVNSPIVSHVQEVLRHYPEVKHQQA
jgi:hypothetical protein